MFEEENVDSGETNQRPKGQQRKGGNPNRLKRISTEELMTSPTIVSCFQELGCYEFCEKVQNIQIHPHLT